MLSRGGRHDTFSSVVYVGRAPVTISSAIVLFITAFIGSTINAVAGGGSFLTLPTLIFTGIAPISANATSTVALWPGSLASVGAYRQDIAGERKLLVALGITSLVGGIFGAIVLLRTNQSTFVHLLPYLLLLATVLFAFSDPLITRLRQGRPVAKTAGLMTIVGMCALQFVIAFYGGYFGGGIGIMMLAGLSLMGLRNIHQMNALKTVLASCINGVAVLIFIIARVVAWPQAVVMLVAAIVGGYGGAYYARKLDPRYVRGAVIAIGVGMTLWFFTHQG